MCEHDLLRPERLLCGGDELVFVDAPIVAEVGAPQGDPGAGGVPHQVAYAREEVPFAREERGIRDPDVICQ
jgi:hypothetical protein